VFDGEDRLRNDSDNCFSGWTSVLSRRDQLRDCLLIASSNPVEQCPSATAEVVCDLRVLARDSRQNTDPDSEEMMSKELVAWMV
jgi:hypothetical protein